MKIAVLILVAIALAPGVGFAEEKKKRRFVEYPKGVLNSHPSRRDLPLRDLNINDLEVAEVQKATRAILPGAIVNIGGVVTGCPCEDGPDCTDQVYVVASTPQSSRGLMLSRITGRWVVGPLQDWWLRYQRAPRCWNIKNEAKQIACLEQEQALVDSFPHCEAQQAVPGSTQPLRGCAP